jgi:hypothetical protein
MTRHPSGSSRLAMACCATMEPWQVKRRPINSLIHRCGDFRAHHQKDFIRWTEATTQITTHTVAQVYASAGRLTRVAGGGRSRDVCAEEAGARGHSAGALHAPRAMLKILVNPESPYYYRPVFDT